MAFTKKELKFTFDLPADQSFDNAPSANRVTISGLRATATIGQSGSVAATAEISIYGLSLSDMTKLSTFGLRREAVRRNTVTVEAGDANGMGVVYGGLIIEGYADFSAMPNNAFHIVSSTTLYAQLKPIPPTTVNGYADVATLMAGLAQQAGFRFENSGVQAQLYCPYYPGTAMDQINQIAAHAGIEHAIDPKTNTLAIWPRGGSRGGAIVKVSPETGMIGYPAFNSYGIIITTS